jgi:short-subunit dehydrogenase
MAAYYASKAYLRSLSNALYAETKGSGVIVTNLSPGFVSTPFLTLSGIGATRLRKILPRMTAAEVAEAGWRGFKSGRRLIVPGLANRILIAGAKLLPTHFLIWLLRQLQRQPDHSASA